MINKRNFFKKIGLGGVLGLFGFKSLGFNFNKKIKIELKSTENNKNEKMYIFYTSGCLVENTKRKYIHKCPVSLQQVYFEGTEDEIIEKVIKYNLFTLFAKNKSDSDNTDFYKEFKKLEEKYLK